MSFEFMYDGEWYKYECGCIKMQRGDDFYVYFCPVSTRLNDKLKDLSIDECQTIMEAIVHGYIYGHAAGQQAKVREFKRVFDID